MLKFIYTFDYYGRAWPEEDDWKFHLSVAQVANKYGLRALEMKAYTNFKAEALSTSDVLGLAELLQELPKYDYARETLSAVEDEILGNHFPMLMDHGWFRDSIKQDGELAVKYLQKVKFAFNLVPETYGKCLSCGNQVMKDPRPQSSKCYGNNHVGSRNRPTLQAATCYIKRSSISDSTESESRAAIQYDRFRRWWESPDSPEQ